MMEDIRDLAAISSKLDNLNNMYSVWHFNNYLRVTYVSPTWLVVWDHRHNPPKRHDFKDVGDHQTVCSQVAEQLQKLTMDERA